MEILLAGSDTIGHERIRQELLPVSIGILNAESFDTLEALYSEMTSLILFTDIDILAQFLAKHPLLLKTTPCVLLLEPEDTLPEFIQQHATLDIFYKTCSSSQLIHKVNFLLMQKNLLEEVTSLSNRLAESDNSIQTHLDFLETLATRDGLTGMFNRRHFNKIFPELYTSSVKTEDDISLLLIDIDYFSQINRSAGQSFGDFVLNELSARITSLIREHKDYSFRFGGGDFTVILPHTEVTQAVKIANKIMDICSEKPFSDGSVTREITVSIGYASRLHNKTQDNDELIAVAEMALFSAKSEGRNRIADHLPPEINAGNLTESSLSSLQSGLKQILEKTKRSTISSLQLLTRDIGGKENLGHIEKASELAQLLCEKLNLPDVVSVTFSNAIAIHSSIRSLFHKEMLMKNGPLTLTEREVLEELPFKLIDLVDQFDYFSDERLILNSYGERFDGSGYPDGLKANEIPLAARIFNLVDALAAMTGDRPYRKRLRDKEILAELQKGAGTQFDPYLVIKLLEIIYQFNVMDIDKKSIDIAIQTLENNLTKQQS